jgi:hypothetical protein
MRWRAEVQVKQVGRGRSDRYLGAYDGVRVCSSKSVVTTHVVVQVT